MGEVSDILIDANCFNYGMFSQPNHDNFYHMNRLVASEYDHMENPSTDVFGRRFFHQSIDVSAYPLPEYQGSESFQYWKTCYDPRSGRPYEYHVVTNEIRWKEQPRPTSFASSKSGSVLSKHDKPFNLLYNNIKDKKSNYGFIRPRVDNMKPSRSIRPRRSGSFQHVQSINDQASITNEKHSVSKSTIGHKKFDEFNFKKTRRRSNSTSTIYLENGTMTNPNVDETIKCIAMLLSANLTDLKMHMDEIPRQFEVFNDDEHQSIPTFETIFAFMKKIYSKAQMEPECIIMSLIYTERLIKVSEGKLYLTKRNWRPILFCSMVMASKLWDDLSMWNADFSRASSLFSLKHLNQLELAYLEICQYRLHVSATCYAKYYFHLRSVRASLKRKKKNSVKNPLSVATARKMKMLSHEYMQKNTEPPRKRSFTLGCIHSKEELTYSSYQTSSVSLEQIVQMKIELSDGTII